MLLSLPLDTPPPTLSLPTPSRWRRVSISGQYALYRLEILTPRPAPPHKHATPAARLAARKLSKHTYRTSAHGRAKSLAYARQYAATHKPQLAAKARAFRARKKAKALLEVRLNGEAGVGQT